MTRRLVGLPLLLVTLLLFGCGGDDKPGARTLLADMFKRMDQEKVVSGTLKTSIVSDDVEVTIDQEAIVEPGANRGYVKTTSSLLDDIENEIYIDGRRAWTRNDKRPWHETTTERLGVNPDSLAATADVSKAAKTVELLSDVTRDGRAAYHVRAVIDPKAKELPEISPQLSNLADLDADEVVMEYFIGKSDRLLYGVKISFEAREDGESFKLTIEAKYHDYGKPPAYPSDLPR